MMPSSPWQQYYTPPVQQNWQGRTDTSAYRLHQKILLSDLTNTIPTTPGFVLLGFCSDTGVIRNKGRAGAAHGPDALRPYLSNIPYHTKKCPVYDAGNIICHDNALEETQTALGHIIAELLKRQHKPIVLGGGHEVAWGHYQGIATHPHSNDIAIINFDAHFDLRIPQNNQSTSGTSFLQITQARQALNQDPSYYCLGIQPYANTSDLFATAHSLNCQYMLASECQNNTSSLIHFMQTLCKKHTAIYLTVCLDVFNQAYAPGVSAPQALGLTPEVLLPAITTLIESGKVISFDIAEYAPPYDRDGQTARLASHLVATYLHHTPWEH